MTDGYPFMSADANLCDGVVYKMKEKNKWTNNREKLAIMQMICNQIRV